MGFLMNLLSPKPPKPHISKAPDPEAKPDAGTQPDTPIRNREDFDPSRPRAVMGVNLADTDDVGIEPINLARR